MSKWISGLMMLSLLGLFAAFGCNNNNEQVGGPGADVQTDDDQEPQEEEATFTAELGEENLELPVGEEKELTLSIDRGEAFEQTVTAQIEPPQGLIVDPETITFDAGQEEGKVMLSADAAAPVGQEQAIEITFQPETGQPIVKQLTVLVVEAEAGDQNQEDQEGVIEEEPQEAAIE